MPKIYIDNIQLEYKEGQTIIEAAKDNGIEIPHFCWHPALSISGNCRMCLVEIEGFTKPAIACSTLAADGMKVYVNSEKAVKARANVMEFLLINHPLDCPICDEAGECKLQDYAYSYSIGESRFNEDKVHKNKRIELGPYVMFDAERCIACSRCIRFSNEIVKEEQLIFVQRGDSVTIETFPGKSFDNPYSLNVVDICPVGALTNREFRFKARVWDMSSTKSICPGCSRGCNIDIWTRNNEILRLTPRFSENVNQYWMCDYGRIETFKSVGADSRIESPMIKKENKYSSVSWDEAISATVSELKRFNKDEILFIASPYSTIEDNYILLKFAKNVFNSSKIFFIEHIDKHFEDNLLKKSDRTPNSTGLKLLGIEQINSDETVSNIINEIKSKKIKALFILDEDISIFNYDLFNNLINIDFIVFLSSNKNSTFEKSNVVFPASSFAEKNGIFVNFDKIIQRIRPAVYTLEKDISLDGKNMGRLEKFGSEFDNWSKSKKIDAKPAWKIISLLARILDKKFNFQSSEEIFIEIANNYKIFENLDYEKIGDNGIKIG